jgi:hypothetical protein
MITAQSSSVPTSMGEGDRLLEPVKFPMSAIVALGPSLVERLTALASSVTLTRGLCDRVVNGDNPVERR